MEKHEKKLWREFKQFNEYTDYEEYEENGKYYLSFKKLDLKLTYEKTINIDDVIKKIKLKLIFKFKQFKCEQICKDFTPLNI